MGAASRRLSADATWTASSAQPVARSEHRRGTDEVVVDRDDLRVVGKERALRDGRVDHVRREPTGANRPSERACQLDGRKLGC